MSEHFDWSSNDLNLRALTLLFLAQVRIEVPQEVFTLAKPNKSWQHDANESPHLAII